MESNATNSERSRANRELGGHSHPTAPSKPPMQADHVSAASDKALKTKLGRRTGAIARFG
jgi:hypothetical protein